MSVIVKGMEMPDTCSRCDILVGTFCQRLNIDVDPFYDGAVSRNNNCPLVEIPEKHGRLIDADYVVEKIRHELGIKDISFLYNAEKSVVNQIFHAPTILKAEGVDE